VPFGYGSGGLSRKSIAFYFDGHWLHKRSFASGIFRNHRVSVAVFSARLVVARRKTACFSVAPKNKIKIGHFAF